MKKIKSVIRYAKREYDLLVAKKYTTFAGTLVFFLIMSVVPLAFWISLLFGRLEVGVEGILRLQVFDSVKKVLDYIRTEAKNATVGASVFLALTSLYSATNLFYQMRKSGEVIYEYNRKSGFKTRLIAAALLFITMAFAVIAVAAFAVGAYFSAKLLPAPIAEVFNYLLLLGISFALVLLLNVYVCPYRAPLKSFLFGSIVTVVAWATSLFGFAIYLKIGNVGRLYGALSAVIVFLLWLYILMICFVSGVILNSERLLNAHSEIFFRKRENISNGESEE